MFKSTQKKLNVIFTVKLCNRCTIFNETFSLMKNFRQKFKKFKSLFSRVDEHITVPYIQEKMQDIRQKTTKIEKSANHTKNHFPGGKQIDNRSAQTFVVNNLIG